MSKAHIQKEANPEAIVALLVFLLLVVVFVQQSGLLSEPKENADIFPANASEAQKTALKQPALHVGS
jgi:hypothetical protein